MKKEGPQASSLNAVAKDDGAAELPAFRAPSGGSGFTQEKSSFSPLWVLVVMAAAIGVLYSQGLIQLGSDEPLAAQAQQLGQAAALPVAEAKAPEKVLPVQPAVPVVEAASAKEEAGVAEKASEPRKAVTKKKASRPKKTKKSKSKVKKSRVKSAPVKTSGASGDDIDDVFKKASGLPSKLPMPEMTAATKKNSASISPCIRSAIDNREVTPGRHTLELSFVILPNGRVQKSRMAGPYYLQGTSLPKCLSTAMRNWRYPKSKEGNRVEKFPIPFKYNP
jgi:hypothetical protein